MVRQPGSQLKLLAGRSHPTLAGQISRRLKVPISGIELGNFANGEIKCQINEKLTGYKVLVIQTHYPNSDSQIFEHCLVIRAAKEAGAKSVIAICPYFGYSREPQAAKLISDTLLKAGANEIWGVDLHEPIKNVKNISIEQLFKNYLQKLLKKDLVIVSPDAGRAKLAERLSYQLDCDWIAINKKRQSDLIEMKLEQGNVKSKICVLVDDIIDTGSTICAAASLLAGKGAKEIYCLATHGMFSEKATDKIYKSGTKKIIITDTVPVISKALELEVLSIIPLMAEITERNIPS